MEVKLCNLKWRSGFLKKRVLAKCKDWRLSRGFSLMELLLTLAIFGILMGIVTSIILINIAAARRIKARTYAREETSFMLKILKKDVRNAESVSLQEIAGFNNLIVKIIEADSGTPATHCYRWFQTNTIVERREIVCSSGTDKDTSYRTPSDIEFDTTDPLNFLVDCEEGNCVVKIRVRAWTLGMPNDTDKQWITKEVAASTRNFGFE